MLGSAVDRTSPTGEIELDAALIPGYLGFLAIALLAPFVAKAVPSPNDIKPPFLMAAILYAGIAGALLLFLARGGLIFPLAPLLLIPLLRRGAWTLTGGVVALSFFAPAIWWDTDPLSLPLWQWAAFAGLTGAAIMVVRAALAAQDSGNPVNEASRSEYLTVFAITALVALGLGACSAPFSTDITGHTAWHHWGAYLSPVESLLAGGVPYRDFPIQYGIGPTLLIAAACGTDCWSGMFSVALVANALYCGTLAVCAAILTAGQGRAIRVLSVVAIGCAALLWTAFPSDFGTALATPSVAGLRFLPLVFQLLFVLCCERNPRQSTHVGHVIWAFNLFWSVEAAAFASLLWWPWLALRAARQGDGSGHNWLIFRYALTGAASLAFGMFVLLAVFRISFGGWPELSTVLAYFQNPPGRWPANPFGPLWLVVIIALMAVGKLMRRDLHNTGTLFACLIAMLAVFSYYLSRSHDNNILNLLPFVLLVALCLLSQGAKTTRPVDAFSHGFSLIFMLSVTVFVAVFNFGVWNKVASAGGLTQTGPDVLIRQVSANVSEQKPIISNDAVALIAEVRKRSPYAPLLFDDKAVMPWATAGTAWTGVNNVANYSPLPPSLVQRYIRRGAARYRRAGWLIVEEENYSDWPRLFASAYDVRLDQRRGRYAAYLMTPKRLPAIPERRSNPVDR